MTGFYHLCFVVADLDQAMRDMSRVLGVDWSVPGDGRLGEWKYRIVFSVQGPPFFEMIQGSPGSPWDASGGSRFDHLGYWTADIAADKDRLAERGAPVEFDSCLYGRAFSYHRLVSIGARVEIVDASVQAAFLETWSPGGRPMPALDIRGRQ